MYPLRPTPTLIVDSWAFRLADPDGNLIGNNGFDLTVTDSTGKLTSITPPPGVEQVMAATAGDN